MSQPTTAPPPRSTLVTLVGLLVFLHGLLILTAAVFVFLMPDKIKEVVDQQMDQVQAKGQVDEKTLNDLRKQVNELFVKGATLLYVLGGCIGLIGLVPFIAGLRVIFRGGRVIAILWGLLTALLFGSALAQSVRQGDYNVQTLGLAGGMVAYGLLTFFVLLIYGREFQKAPAPPKT
jgi:hypothetical protein